MRVLEVMLRYVCYAILYSHSPIAGGLEGSQGTDKSQCWKTESLSARRHLEAKPGASVSSPIHVRYLFRTVVLPHILGSQGGDFIV